MKKKICFLMSLFMMLSVPLYAEAVEPEKDEIKAKSVLLMCMDTGDVLYADNEYEHLSPASVTKIMSVLLFVEAIDDGKISLTDKVIASENAVSKGGSQIWLEVGESMTVDELLKAVIIASANDACTALSEYVGGSATGFVKMMNDRAKELKLKNTCFENCTGLDDDTKNHYSCAYDIAVMSQEVMKHELVKNYTTVWLDSLRGGETELNNTNKLVNKYDGITGLKTGTTSNAGFCISATACRDDMNLVAVVLGSETSDDRFYTASYLLDFGFANYQVITPEIDKSRIKSVKVKNGVKKLVIPVAEKSSKICVEKGNGEVSYDYKVKKEINAPLKKGASLGSITVLIDENEVGKIKLVSKENIEKISLKVVFFNILRKI